jgi:hypothetical protein
VRVLVAQLVETERAALGDFDRARDGFGNRGVAAGDFVERVQMALGVGKQAAAGFGERAPLANARQHVLQITPLGNVVMHVISGDKRDAGALRQLGKLGEASLVGQVVGQFGGEVELVAEDLAVAQ